jgi:hypothetical protein
MEGVLTGFHHHRRRASGSGFCWPSWEFSMTSSQRVLRPLAFFVASPALMITVLGETDVSALFSANLIASLAGVTVVRDQLSAARPAGLASVRPATR